MMYLPYLSLYILTFGICPSLGTLNLDKKGYEHCIFNLVDSNTRETLEPTDLTESILVQNQGTQLWTITVLPDPKYPLDKVYQDDDDSIVDNGFLREICSVNFFVAMQGEPQRNVYVIFGSRFYSAKNMFFILLRNPIVLEKLWLDFGITALTHINTFVLKLSINQLSQPITESAHWLCVTSNPRIHINISTDFKGLRQLNELSTTLKQSLLIASVLNIQFGGNSGFHSNETLHLPCTFRNLQKRLSRGIGGKLRCSLDERFIETSAEKFNLSVLHYRLDNLTRWLTRAHNCRATAQLRQSRFLVGQRLVCYEKAWTQFLYDIGYFKFIYCPEHPERETFSFLFWTVPFDTWGWLSLTASSVIIMTFFQGSWLDVTGILWRQGISVLTGKQMLVILMLVTIVITCCYESIISGYLTVPPPFVIVKSLKELIDEGYKIIGYGQGEHSELEEIFKNENITSHSLTESMVNGSFSWTLEERITALSAANTTLPLHKSSKYDKELLTPELTSKMCYYAPQTRFSQPVPMIFGGLEGFKFARAAQLLKESGVLQMYSRLHYFMSLYSTNRIRDLIESVQQEPLPFKVSDWKISSIFCTWLCLNGLASFAFIVELLWNSHKFLVPGFRLKVPESKFHSGVVGRTSVPDVTLSGAEIRTEDEGFIQGDGISNDIVSNLLGSIPYYSYNKV